MPVIENRRDALAPLPYLLVVKPSGDIYRAEYASNIGGTAIMIIDGVPTLRPGYVKDGCRLLKDVVDSPAQFAALEAYFEEARRLSGHIVPLKREQYPKYCQKLMDEAAQVQKPYDFAAIDAAAGDKKAKADKEPKDPGKADKDAKP